MATTTATAISTITTALDAVTDFARLYEGPHGVLEVQELPCCIVWPDLVGRAEGAGDGKVRRRVPLIVCIVARAGESPIAELLDLVQAATAVLEGDLDLPDGAMVDSRSLSWDCDGEFEQRDGHRVFARAEVTLVLDVNRGAL